MPFSCVLKCWPRHTHLKLIYLSLPICPIIWALKWTKWQNKPPNQYHKPAVKHVRSYFAKEYDKSNILMPCFKHFMVSCITLYTNAWWFLQTSSSIRFYAFHQRTCFNFTNRIRYNFKINGVCLHYNSGFKLSMKVERTFFSWFFYILCPFLQYSISLSWVSWIWLKHTLISCWNIDNVYVQPFYVVLKTFSKVPFCQLPTVTVKSSFSLRPFHIADTLFSQTFFSETGWMFDNFS